MAASDTRTINPAWLRDHGVETSRPLLTRAERAVLRMARRDGLASLEAPHAGGLRRLLGMNPANRLADPRLEALRRYAVLLVHLGERMPASEQAAIVAAGFTPAQVAEVRRTLGGDAEVRRPASKRRLVAVAALFFAAQLLIFRLASAYASDGMIGFLATLAATVAGAPLLGLLLRPGQGAKTAPDGLAGVDWATGSRTSAR